MPIKAYQNCYLQLLLMRRIVLLRLREIIGEKRCPIRQAPVSIFFCFFPLCISVDAGCSTGWGPVPIHDRTAYKTYPTTGEQRTPTMPQSSRRPSLVPCPHPFNHHIHFTNSCFWTWLGGSSSKALAYGPHGPRINSSLGLPVKKAWGRP